MAAPFFRIRFTIGYKQRICNTEADTLSRLRTLGEATVPVAGDIPCLTCHATEYETEVSSDDINDERDPWLDLLAIWDYNPLLESLTPLFAAE